jgi:hypothetical protein
MATVVGIPLGLALLLVALPVLGLLGAVVAAAWIGFMILERGDLATRPEHPFGAALLGVAILTALMILPGIGFLAVALMSIWGMGALVLRVVKPSRAPARREPLESEPEAALEVE